MMMFADTSRGRPFAKDPAVVRLGDRYLTYYTICPFGDDREGDGYGIGIAESLDLDNWTKIDEIQPVQECEQNGICAPGAIVLDETVHLFYQPYGNHATDAICHETAPLSGGFVREWSRATVKMDCNRWAPTVTFKPP